MGNSPSRETGPGTGESSLAVESTATTPLPAAAEGQEPTKHGVKRKLDEAIRQPPHRKRRTSQLSTDIVEAVSELSPGTQEHKQEQLVGRAPAVEAADEELHEHADARPRKRLKGVRSHQLRPKEKSIPLSHQPVQSIEVDSGGGHGGKPSPQERSKTLLGASNGRLIPLAKKQNFSLIITQNPQANLAPSGELQDSEGVTRSSPVLSTRIRKLNRKKKPEEEEEADSDADNASHQGKTANFETQVSPTDQHSQLASITRGNEAPSNARLKRPPRKINSHRKEVDSPSCKQGSDKPVASERHEEQTGYESSVPAPDTKRGLFTSTEQARLSEFKQTTCNDLDFTEFEFNELMTHLGQRDSTRWPYTRIKKWDLRKEFYGVLPNRPRRSMNRYRERHFVNIVKDREWTEDDEKELKILIDEKGHRWVEIARIIGRTQDEVYTKWKNKLRQGDNLRTNFWSGGEREALIEVVRDYKQATNLAQDLSSDRQINWTAVSERFGFTRNAQQCSVCWNRMFRGKGVGAGRGRSAKPRKESSSLPHTERSTRRSQQAALEDAKIASSSRIQSPERNEKPGERAEAVNDRPVGSKKLVKIKGRKHNIKKPDLQRASKNAKKTVSGAESSEQFSSEGDEDAKVTAQDRLSRRSPQKKQRLNGISPVSERKTITAKSKPATESLGLSTPSRRINWQSQQGSTQAGKENPKDTTDSDPSPLRSITLAERTPRLPVSKGRSGDVHSLSQAFAGTQAPSSTKSGKLPQLGILEMEDRPSPDIEMNLRPVSRDDRSECDQLELLELIRPGGEHESSSQSEISSSESEHGESPQMFTSAPPRATDTSSAESSNESESEEDEQMISENEESHTSHGDTAPTKPKKEDGKQLPDGVIDIKSKPQISEAESSAEDLTHSNPTRHRSTNPSDLPSASESDNDDGTFDFDDESFPAADAASNAASSSERSPQLFSSALPNWDDVEESDSEASSDRDAAIVEPKPTLFPSASPSTSTEEAVTIAPTMSSRASQASAAASSSANNSNEDSGDESDNSMVLATQRDFLSNQEAQAKATARMRSGRGVQRARKGGMWGRRGEVVD